MEGWIWNGGRESPWSYHQDQETTTGSSVVSCSRSGTIVAIFSTPWQLAASYSPASVSGSSASASSGSRFTLSSAEADMYFDSLSLGLDHWDWKEEAAAAEEPPSSSLAICTSIQVCDVTRWLTTELGVGWVLGLQVQDAAGASAVMLLDRHALTWIQALDKIAQAISCFTSPLFPDRIIICDQEGEPVAAAAAAEKCLPDRYHFALFIQETMLKVLAFLDVVAAVDPDTTTATTEEFLSMDRGMVVPYSYSKLFNLLGLHDALSKASDKILKLFDSPASVEEVQVLQRIENEMDILLSAYRSKLGGAIRSTVEKTMTRFLEDGSDDDDSSGSLNPRGSSDIHRVTQLVMTYIRCLWANHSPVDAAIRRETVPHHTENARPLDSMIMETVSCLQEKLVNISESFPDQGLRFLFLLNNLCNIKQIHNLYCYSPQQRSKIDIDLTHKIEGLMERCVQVSWEPLLSCLFNPTPLCLGKNSSPLSKFESEFQKTYTAQMEWKVPDPELRRRLRKAITDKIIPGYTEYIEDNKVTHPKISPHEMKEMLQELFEG